jgi:hypothetical protein
MTDKQLKQAEQQLREEMHAKGYGWINGNYIRPSKQYKIREKELDCISMINSILAYQGAGMTDAEAVMQMEENAYRNYLAEYVTLFGRDKVVTLIQGQIDDIDHVQHNVHTDSEGCSYNSIVWKEVA